MFRRFFDHILMISAALVIFVIGAGAMPILSDLGQRIESNLFPVSSKLAIVSMEPAGHGATRIMVRFSKSRACEYLGLSWYRGKANGLFERVKITFAKTAGDDSGTSRSTGEQTAGPWVVSIPMDEIRTNSFAELTHRCHPMWVSKTAFYP